MSIDEDIRPDDPSAAQAAASGHGAEPARVSALELFFDLVFVFTITQLTDGMAHSLHGEALGRVCVMLALIWWMYSGYVWLTNAVPPTTRARRVLLMIAMEGFLAIALAVPHAFDGSGVWFGVGYLVVATVHTGMYAAAGASGGAIRRLGPVNLAGAGLVLAGGFLDGTPQLLVWAAALLLQAGASRFVRLDAFPLHAHHFVERHGLVVIIAFGESVIAIGLGVGSKPTLVLVTTALFTLCVCYALWWAYFGVSDDEHAVDVLDELPAARRNPLALGVYGLGHYVLLLGVLVFAAGVKTTLAHPTTHTGARPALALACGVALFVAANCGIRRAFGLTPVVPRVVVACLLPLTALVGTQVSMLAQVIATLAVTGAAFAVEDRLTRQPPEVMQPVGSVD